MLPNQMVEYINKMAELLDKQSKRLSALEAEVEALKDVKPVVRKTTKSS